MVLLGPYQQPKTWLSQLLRPLVWAAAVAMSVATTPYWPTGKALKIDAWEDRYEVGPIGNENDSLYSTISGMCANQVRLGKLEGPGSTYFDAIGKYNHIDPGNLREGMTITVPSAAHWEPVTFMERDCGEKGSTSGTLCSFIDKHYR